jgi:hypothetical protein
MIVGPHKGVFFAITAIMYSVSLYGAELLAPANPMARVFIGVPNRLTLPPGFQSDAPQVSAPCAAVEEGRTRSAQAEAVLNQNCLPPLAQPDLDPDGGRAVPVPAANSGERVVAQPAAAASTVETR